MSTKRFIYYEKTYRRSTKRKPLVEGSAEAATLATHKPYLETQPDGSVEIKYRLESLDDPRPKERPNNSTNENNSTNLNNYFNNDEIPNNSPPQTPRPRKRWVHLIIK
jgi:hypothetical protein